MPVTMLIQRIHRIALCVLFGTFIFAVVREIARETVGPDGFRAFDAVIVGVGLLPISWFILRGCWLVLREITEGL